jgi:hypothetical protein
MENASKNDNVYIVKIIHKIKNQHYFTHDMLIKINEMSAEDRLKVLCAFNEMMKYYSDIIDSL